MSLLSTVGKPSDRPPIITIVGDAGTGKTTLAATFPKSIFIRAEDGMQSIPPEKRPDAFPLLQSADDLWPQLLALLNEDHDYKTVVIDSVSALDVLFTKYILEKDGRAQTLATALGGYGAGIQALTGMHVRLRKAAGLLNIRRGMNVVFVGHADLETMRLPDVDDYSRYSVRLPAKSLPPYVDDVDMVCFIRLVTALRGKDDDRKKIISNGDRELVAHATASSVSKNRFGIIEAIDCPQGENPLFGLIPGIAGIRAAKAEPKEERRAEAKADDVKAARRRAPVKAEPEAEPEAEAEAAEVES